MNIWRKIREKRDKVGPTALLTRVDELEWEEEGVLRGYKIVVKRRLPVHVFLVLPLFAMAMASAIYPSVHNMAIFIVLCAAEVWGYSRIGKTLRGVKLCLTAGLTHTLTAMTLLTGPTYPIATALLMLCLVAVID